MYKLIHRCSSVLILKQSVCWKVIRKKLWDLVIRKKLSTKIMAASFSPQKQSLFNHRFNAKCMSIDSMHCRLYLDLASIWFNCTVQERAQAVS